jgi:hypothetical protein
MTHVLERLGRTLQRLRIGNIAVASALALMPLVLVAGFLTDRDRLPGSGISARAGLQASADAPEALPHG